MDLLVAAFATALVLSALDYFIDLPGWARIALAVPMSAGALDLLGVPVTLALIPSSLACAFASLASIIVVERLTVMTAVMRRTR